MSECKCEHDWTCDSIDGFEYCRYCNLGLVDHVKILEARCARYKATLEQYADEKNWDEVWGVEFMNNHGYELAKDALEDE